MAKLKLMDKDITKKYERSEDEDEITYAFLSRVLRSVYPPKRNYSEKHSKLFKKFLKV